MQWGSSTHGCGYLVPPALAPVFALSMGEDHAPMAPLAPSALHRDIQLPGDGHVEESWVLALITSAPCFSGFCSHWQLKGSNRGLSNLPPVKPACV